MSALEPALEPITVAVSKEAVVEEAAEPLTPLAVKVPVIAPTTDADLAPGAEAPATLE